MAEALKSPAEIELQQAIVKRLQRKAPRHWKCIFLNCELRETAGGMSSSEDLFAVTQSLFGMPKREEWNPDTDTVLMLFELGRLVCLLAGQPWVAVDFIILKDGSFKSFADFGPLRRLNGGDRFFRAKYKDYLDIEPLLKSID